MKKITAYIFIIWTINICSAQKVEMESVFFQDIILPVNDSIIYAGESYGWEKMKEKLNRKKFKDYNLNNTNTIKLTDYEYNYLFSEISANENYKWNSKQFPNSEKVSQNEIESHLKRKNEPYLLESENISPNDTSAVVEMKNKRYFVYSFSKPIFFRDNKFCIFAFCTKMGNNSKDYCKVAFYRKRNGKWTEWLEIYNNLD